MTSRSVNKQLRRLIWDKYCDRRLMQSNCYCCSDVIDFETFEAGHVIAFSQGGSTELPNLRPICRMCNQSMGTMNLYDYKQQLKEFKNDPKDSILDLQCQIQQLILQQQHIEKILIPINQQLDNQTIPRLQQQIYEIPSILGAFKDQILQDSQKQIQKYLNEIQSNQPVEKVEKQVQQFEISQIKQELTNHFESYISKHFDDQKIKMKNVFQRIQQEISGIKSQYHQLDNLIEKTNTIYETNTRFSSQLLDLHHISNQLTQDQEQGKRETKSIQNKIHNIFDTIERERQKLINHVENQQAEIKKINEQLKKQKESQQQQFNDLQFRLQQIQQRYDQDIQNLQTDIDALNEDEYQLRDDVNYILEDINFMNSRIESFKIFKKEIKKQLDIYPCTRFIENQENIQIKKERQQEALIYNGLEFLKVRQQCFYTLIQENLKEYYRFKPQIATTIFYDHLIIDGHIFNIQSKQCVLCPLINKGCKDFCLQYFIVNREIKSNICEQIQTFFYKGHLIQINPVYIQYYLQQSRINIKPRKFINLIQITGQEEFQLNDFSRICPGICFCSDDVKMKNCINCRFVQDQTLIKVQFQSYELNQNLKLKIYETGEEREAQMKYDYASGVFSFTWN